MTLETVFKKEKIASSLKISKELLAPNLGLSIGQVADDIIMDTFSVQIEAFIYSNTVEQRTLEYYCPRPSFWDWLFHRQKRVTWQLSVKDLLKNPPSNAARIVVVERSAEDNSDGVFENPDKTLPEAPQNPNNIS